MSLREPPSASPPRGAQGAPPWRMLLRLALGLGVVSAAYLYMSGMAAGLLQPGFFVPGLSTQELGSAAASAAGPLIEPLRSEERARCEDQRAHVARLARRHVGTPLTGSELRDLRVLQDLVDRKVLDRDQTYELQALGIALGDVLAAQLGLSWVAYQDERGRSRALRIGDGDVVLFPVTMISRRYEVGVPVDVQTLYDEARAVVEAQRASPAL